MFRHYDAEDVEAATLIQTNMRRVLAQKKYAIKHLERNKMNNYGTFVVGNDPLMPKELNNYHEPDKKIAFIATSGLRALSLACKIGNAKNIPKIMLIDNSQQVCDFWVAFRAFLSDDAKAGTAELLYKNLPEFLCKHKHLYRALTALTYANDEGDGRKYLNQDINIYLKAVIGKYGFDFVRAVVRHASIIRQSWAHTDTFVKVKNILALHGIERVYIYPSNIIACVDSKCDKDAILSNIESLSPVLAIHTDLGPSKNGHGLPQNVHLLENNQPSNVLSKIATPCMFSRPAQGKDVEELSALLSQLFGSDISDKVQIVSVSLK